MATRTITLTTEQLSLLNNILSVDSRRNALPIAIEKGFNVSLYLNTAEAIEYIFESANKEDEYVEARQK